MSSEASNLLDLVNAWAADWTYRKVGQFENSSGAPARNKMGRKPLKSQETAKSNISRPNDFNILRAPSRNKIVSQAKFPVSQAKFSLRKRNLQTIPVGRDARTYRDFGL
jgi:hypothetical protein